jgi:hypothetical protein
VGAPATLVSFNPRGGGTNGPVHTLSGNCLRQVALRGEQREQLGRRDQSQTSQASHGEKKKLQNACRLVQVNSLKKGATQSLDPLLDNDHATINYTTAVTR